MKGLPIELADWDEALAKAGITKFSIPAIVALWKYYEVEDFTLFDVKKPDTFKVLDKWEEYTRPKLREKFMDTFFTEDEQRKMMETNQDEIEHLAERMGTHLNEENELVSGGYKLILTTAQTILVVSDSSKI